MERQVSEPTLEEGSVDKYEFGWPDNSQTWEKMVNEAIVSTDLKWMKEADSQLRTAGSRTLFRLR